MTVVSAGVCAADLVGTGARATVPVGTGVRPAVPIGTELVPVGEFGPLDALSDEAHRLYAEGCSEASLKACEAGLTVAELSGDHRTARFLRYIVCLNHEQEGHWRRLEQSSARLLDGLGPDASVSWRAKALGLYSHAMVQQNEATTAIEALAEAYSLISCEDELSYNRGSACQAVSGPLHSLLLFAPAREVLVTSVALLAEHPQARVLGLLQQTVVEGTWAMFLELLGLDDEARAHHQACASLAVRASAEARVLAHEYAYSYAEALLQFAHQRLGVPVVDPRPLLVMLRRPGAGRDGLLCGLALASDRAQAGDLTRARGLARWIRLRSARFGEPVPGWVATAWLAHLAEAEHGSSNASRRWRDAAVGQLEQLWRDRAGRFEYLVARRGVVELSARLARQDRRLWEDALTRVGNRRLLDAVQADPAAAARGTAFVDIDHFKGVNDRFGHAVGDHVLRRVATLLRSACGDRDLVARYGGDEFVVVLDEDTDPRRFVERVHLAVRGAGWSALAPGLAVTVSVGTAAPGEGALRRADAALLRVKAARP